MLITHIKQKTTTFLTPKCKCAGRKAAKSHFYKWFCIQVRCDENLTHLWGSKVWFWLVIVHVLPHAIQCHHDEAYPTQSSPWALLLCIPLSALGRLLVRPMRPFEVFQINYGKSDGRRIHVVWCIAWPNARLK